MDKLLTTLDTYQDAMCSSQFVSGLAIGAVLALLTLAIGHTITERRKK